MKHLKLFFALFAMLALGVGNAWAESIEINTTSSGVNGSYRDYEFDVNSITFGCTQWMKNNNIQAKKSTTNSLYNVDAIPGTITSIVVKQTGTARAIKVYGGTSTKPTTQITSPSTAAEMTFDFTGKDYTYFSLTTPSNACYFDKITINYTPSSSGGDPEPGTGGETPEPEPGTGGELVGEQTATYVVSTATAVTTSGIVPDGSSASLSGTGSLSSGFIQCTNGKNHTLTLKGYAGYKIKSISIHVKSNSSKGTGSFSVVAGSTTIASIAESAFNTADWNGSWNNSGVDKVLTMTNDSYEIQSGEDVKLTINCKSGSSNYNSLYIKSYTVVYESTSTGGETPEPETPATELTNDQFAWSAATAEATMGASNTFPTLIKTLPVSVTYESSNTAAATIAADGTITLVAPGTTTISAKFAGGEVSGTTYAPKTVTYALTVLKAPATPTSTVYVKVTSTAGITDGEYLIVYEDAEGNPKAPVAFDGSLETLDAAGNMMSVTITDNVINGNTEIDEVTFNISAMTGGYAIKSKIGKYIGRTSSGNGMNTGASEILNIITITDGKTTISGSGDGASTSLQYYSVSGSERFRYYGSNQKPIALYKKVDPSEILAPAFSVAAGSFYDAQSVVITCATPGAEIYYTLDGSTPSSTSTKYTSAVAISETKTLKAIAIKGEYSSSVTEATYTILAPLATMQEIFDKATAVDGTATPVKVTMNNWVVTGVKGSNAYLTDGTKGLIIYTASHGFVVGDVLSGTVACKVQLYDGSAELTSLTKTTEGLTVTTGGTVTPVVVNDVTTLNGVNTGSVIKITGTCTVESSKYYVADVQLYNSLFAYTNPTVGKKYNVTGVYLQYGEVEEILPRKQEDIEEVQDLATATISVSNISLEVDETKTIEATITPDAAKTTVKYTITAGSENVTLNGATITGVKEGTATITATIAEAAGEYYGTTKDFTVTVTPKSTKDNVVVLAKYGDQWYAMMAQYVSGKTSHLAALPVSYVGGKLYNVADADKALIEWTRAVVDGKATFSNNSKYLTGKSDKTDLTLAATSCDWTISGESYLIGERTFFYNAENNWFRNFKIENVDAKNYSGMPVVTAPVYTTGTLYTIKATAENGTVVGAGVYVAGDKVTLTADPAMDYTFVSWTKGGEVVSTANPFVFEATENLDLVANFAEISQTSNTLTGEFSVGQYEVAQFATGNLQYNVKDEKWSFAKQQYQYVGEANINVGDTKFTGTIDMFGWSGDGKFGVNPSNKNEDYYGTFQDWGTKMGEGWLTLSADQWNYLLNTRTNAEDLKQIARVGSVVGIMLFPDVWNAPLTVTAQPDSYFEVDIHNYTLEQWAELEEAGALFLPAAGRRTGGYSNMINYDQQVETREDYLVNGGFYRWKDNTNIYCYYWTSTINEDKNVSYLHNIVALGNDEYTIGTGAIWGEKGRYGQSVRLAKVTDVTPETYTRTVTNGEWGTICLPYASNSFTGATFYEVSSLVVGEGLWLDQLADGDQLVAGKPYIFQATATEIAVTYTGEAVGTPIAGVNGLTGTFTDIAAGGLTGNYIIAENQVWRAGTGATLSANRAYIDASGVPTTAQVQLPGRRRVCMGENAATGLNNITNGENTTIKTIENGQLIIIRNGEKFNAQGQRL